MKVYELMVITSGAATEEEASKTVAEIEKLIKAKKGTVTALDEWGKRKLAYPILKQDFGYYNVWRFTADGGNVPADLQNALKIQDGVLRSLVTIANTKKKLVKASEGEEAEATEATTEEPKTKKKTQPETAEATT